KSIVIALIAGALSFLVLWAITPRAVALIENGELTYRKQSVKLAQLTTVSKFATYNLTFFLGANFTMTLTDREGGKLKLPLGNWQDQNDLLAIIGKAASESGATVDKQSLALIEKAKN